MNAWEEISDGIRIWRNLPARDPGRHNFEHHAITGASGIMFDTAVGIYKVDKSRRPDFPPLISFFLSKVKSKNVEAGMLIWLVGTDPNCYDNCMPREVPQVETSKELCVVLWCSSLRCQNVRKWNAAWKHLGVAVYLPCACHIGWKCRKQLGALFPPPLTQLREHFRARFPLQRP